MSHSKRRKDKKRQRSPYLAVVTNDAHVTRRIEHFDVRRAIELLPDARPLEQRPIGPHGSCYPNALTAVVSWGGRMVVGWLVSQDGLPFRLGSRNPLARVTMYAHAVWETPDHRLVEVTEGVASGRFVPDMQLGFCGGGEVQFPDDYWNARRVIAELRRSEGLPVRWSIVWINSGREQNIGGLWLPPGTSLVGYRTMKRSMLSSVELYTDHLAC
jgi:hypothetical protein